MSLRDDVKLYPAHDWVYLTGNCGHCGRPSNFAAIGSVIRVEHSPAGKMFVGGEQLILVCSGCHGVNIDAKDRQGLNAAWHPSPIPGRKVEGLPEDVGDAWHEARAALGAEAPIASEHMCRKILIHIAAEQGSKGKLTFQQAIDFLVQTGTITESMKEWVDQIRLNGNDAAHELERADPRRARLTLEFTQQLLQVVYETKHRLKALAPKAK